MLLQGHCSSQEKKNKKKKFGITEQFELIPKQLGQKHQSSLWNSRALPKQILRVGFNIIYVTNSETGNLLVTTCWETLCQEWNTTNVTIIPQTLNRAKARREQPQLCSWLKLQSTRMSPSFLGTRSPPAWAAPETSSARAGPCISEQGAILIFLVGMGQHFPGLDLMGVNVFTCLCFH